METRCGSRVAYRERFEGAHDATVYLEMREFVQKERVLPVAVHSGDLRWLNAEDWSG
jgi:hypothetical protein